MSVRQQEHEFLFGSALNASQGRLDPSGTSDALEYQSEAARLFNTVTSEYELQWRPIEDFEQGFEVLEFAEENDLYARGHSGIWPSREWMPQSVWDQYDQLLANQGATVAEEYLRTVTTERIQLIATTFADLTEEWDVVNEPRTNNDVMQILGDDIIVDWFREFRTADPSASLTLNEFSIFTNNGANGGNLDNLQYWLDLLAVEDLVDVIGEQSHYDEGNLTDIDTLGDLINDLHTTNNLPINITELDVNTTDLQLQADYLRDYLTQSFSQPGIEKIVQWGFWEGRHWRPDAALYREDFSIKPNGQAYEDLVYGNWWTDTRGTSFDGALTTSAFLGEYEIVVEFQGETYTSSFTHNGSGQDATVVLPVTTVGCDIDGDGVCDCDDVDALQAAIVAGNNDSLYDIDGNGVVNVADRNEWLAVAGSQQLASGASYGPADGNLDGVIDASDFNVWNSSRFTANSGFCSGDFNVDGVVDASDFNVWNANRFTMQGDTSSGQTSPVSPSAAIPTLPAVGLVGASGTTSAAPQVIVGLDSPVFQIQTGIAEDTHSVSTAAERMNEIFGERDESHEQDQSATKVLTL